MINLVSNLMYEPAVLAIIFATFVAAGLVKGVIGMGLPLVTLSVLAFIVGLTDAMALTLVSAFATNVWQAMVGGHGRAVLARAWPFLILSTSTVWLGAKALVFVDVLWLTGLLGILVAVYAGLNLLRVRLEVPRRNERWVGPLVGVVNGVFAGMTGTFVFPGVLYLQAIGLTRDQLIQAMGMLFSASSFALALALGGNNLLTAELSGLSVAAIVPAILGMNVGLRIRSKLSEQRFRQVFFISLLLLGLMLIGRTVF